MKRLIAFVAFLGVICLMPSPVAGQSVWFAVGPSFAVNDYADYANTGFLLSAGVAVPVGDQGLSVFGDAFFGQNSHDTDGDKTNPYGVMGGVMLDLADEGEVGVYFFGQLGILWHKYGTESTTFEGSTESALGIGAGAGVSVPLGSVTGFLEGRAMSASFDDGNTAFIGTLAGISIPVGGN